jgi:DNA invertase Pin-like site-specific DNA recombinase
MTKAYAYLRVSGKAQLDGDRFKRQSEAVRHYAQAQGMEVVKFFRDEGVSDTTDLENRPALLAMLEALLSNGVKTVLIEKLDRLARDLMIQESIIDDFQRRGVELISVMEPDLLQDDPSRKAFRQITGVFAEYEKSMIVLKLRAARNRVKATTGRCEGRKPYGFYEPEKRVLERMSSLRETGMGYDRIAETLNAEGLKPRTGEKWWGKTANNILGSCESRVNCRCGTELLVQWQARIGPSAGHHFVRCPECRTSHDTPDVPIRVFRRVGNGWLKVESKE